jgi:hypothetical protein
MRRPWLMKNALIELADTTFRAYRKKNGAIALHLRSYLIVHTDAAFRAKREEARAKRRVGTLSTLRELSLFVDVSPRCWIRLPGKTQHECDLVYYSEYPVKRPTVNSELIVFEEVNDHYKECILHHFWVDTILGDKNVEPCIADMKLIFRLNFPGRARDEELLIRRKVPVVTRFVARGSAPKIRRNGE